MEWPDWWSWELELTPHVQKRMEDRDFTELDLRQMLESANGLRPDILDDRYVIESALRGRHWEVIVEPDAPAQRLVVITAYPLGG